jgi:hypothetical protein
MSRGVNSWIGNYWIRRAALACFILISACAGPPKPMPLDAYHVEFATDSYAIDGAGQRAVESVAQAVAGKSGARVTIVGRTDPTGSPAYNMQLSQKRAAAVHDALVATGEVTPDRIDTSWAAEQPQSAAAGTAPPPGDKVVDIYLH